MKTLIASDIHGVIYYAKKLREIYEKEKPDISIILGDLYFNYNNYEDNSNEIKEILENFRNLYVFKGNCDSEIDELVSSFPLYDYLVLNINNKKLFCSHGNKYNPNKLPCDKFDIMAYGHTHVGKIFKSGDLIFVNPGSLSYPRGGTTNSYIIINEDEIFLKDIDGNIIEYLKI